MRSTTVHRSIRSAAVVVVATATSLAVLALPAVAADATVTDIGALQTSASSCTDGDVITIGADIAAPAGVVTTGCSMTLDLNDQDLSVAQILIAPGTTLTIDGGTAGAGTLTALAQSKGAAIRTAGASLVIDSGTITATGQPSGQQEGGAGIGGGDFGEAGGSVTIHGGTVAATGSPLSAGIGGGPFGKGGTIAITGGTVTAAGNVSSAGIGGGAGGGRGAVTISGGSVTATGGDSAAGMGSGANAAADNSGSAVITGGTVTAQGGAAAAGIGGGARSNGGDVVIGAGADVTAAGGRNAADTANITGVGGGEAGANPVSFGSLSVAAILRIPTTANLTVMADGSATVTATGVITGANDQTDGGQIVGPGTIANAGSIVLPDARVVDATTPAAITGHHYAVTFDTQGGSAAPAPVTVFAASFAAGARTLPAPPTKDGATFTGWSSTADGTGTPIDATSTLPGTATGGPLAITAYAQYRATVITGLAPAVTGTQRERAVLTARPGAVSPAGTTVAYQWLSDGRPIVGSTSRTLRLGKKQAGHRIAVRITAASSGVPSVIRTSARTRLVSSSSRRLVLSDRTIARGQRFRVIATGFRPGQRIRVWLGGDKAVTTRADSTGTISRSVRFAGGVDRGTRSVRVSGYRANGTRSGTIHTTVRYRR